MQQLLCVTVHKNFRNDVKIMFSLPVLRHEIKKCVTFDKLLGHADIRACQNCHAMPENLLYIGRWDGGTVGW